MEVLESFRELFSSTGSPADLTSLQVVARGVIVFAASLVLVRLAESRFLGKETAFDALLGFLLGSMLSRAINGSARMVPTLVGGAVLILLHRVLAHAACRAPWLARVIKGRSRMLARDGRIDEPAMRSCLIDEHDLREGLRMAARVDDPRRVAAVYLERNGHISAVKGEAPPRVVEVPVENGVKTVRIELAS